MYLFYLVVGARYPVHNLVHRELVNPRLLPVLARGEDVRPVS
jgi:hypothetical protein